MIQVDGCICCRTGGHRGLQGLGALLQHCRRSHLGFHGAMVATGRSQVMWGFSLCKEYRNSMKLKHVPQLQPSFLEIDRGYILGFGFSLYFWDIPSWIRMMIAKLCCFGWTIWYCTHIIIDCVGYFSRIWPFWRDKLSLLGTHVSIFTTVGSVPTFSMTLESEFARSTGAQRKSCSHGIVA